MNAHSTIAPTAHVFDPRKWLERFKEDGGFWITPPDGKTRLGVSFIGTTLEQQRAAKLMLDELAGQPERRKAIAAYRPEAYGGPTDDKPLDYTIIKAWQDYVQVRNDLNGIDDDLLGCETHQENEIWARADVAEKTIHNTRAETPEGTAIKLWLALCHMIDRGVQETAVLARDVEALERIGAGLDWDARLILSAIKSLHVVKA